MYSSRDKRLGAQMVMNCTICDAPADAYSSTSFFKKPVYYCRMCHIYISDDDPEIYEQEYWDNRAAVASIESGYTDEGSVYRKYLLESQLEYCKELVKGKKVLEVGSGAGQTLYFLEQRGFSVSGIEPDVRNVEMINRKLSSGKCLAGYAEQVDITETYDIIWISHVFEHVQNPKVLLDKLCQHVKEFIFIEVPNAENHEILKSSIYDNPSHFHYEKRALLLLAEKTHFTVIKCDYMRHMNARERGLHKKLPFIRRFFPYYPYVASHAPESEVIRILLRPRGPGNRSLE